MKTNDATFSETIILDPNTDNLHYKYTKSRLTKNRQPFFRKIAYIPRSGKPYTGVQNEIQICNVLIKHRLPNVVNIYEVTSDHIDMELLDVKSVNYEEARCSMHQAKEQLESVGIMYMDWKLDNVGKNKEGIYKVFDFDISGLIDLKNPTEWLVSPLKYYSYKRATEEGAKTPIEIDNYAFTYF